MTELVYPPGFTFWQALQRGLVEPRSCPAYLHWLHELPCAVLNTRRAITVHHVIGHQLKGVGGKTCDFLAFPLEAHLHLPEYPRAIHAMNFGWKRWEEEHGSQLEYSLHTILEAVHRGVLVFKKP